MVAPNFKNPVLLVLLLALPWHPQKSLAWLGDDNRFYSNNRSFSDASLSFTDYNRLNDSFYPSSRGLFTVNARDDFRESPVYSGYMTVWKFNNQVSQNLQTYVAPNINLSDYSGYKITNESRFESFSNLSRQYEPFSFSNVKQDDGKLTSFDRTSARGNWFVTDQVANITYGQDNRPLSLSINTRDIAGNTLQQKVSDLRYVVSSDADRYKSMLDLAKTNSTREGFFNFGMIVDQLGKFPEPAKLVPEAFSMEITDPEGFTTQIRFTEVQWLSDRVVGFTAGFAVEEIETQVKAIPQEVNNGKLGSLSIEITNDQGAQTVEWKVSDGITLNQLTAKLFSNHNPFTVMGNGNIQVADSIVPSAANSFNGEGLLENMPKDFVRNYGIKDNPWFGKETNELKIQIFQLEQTDKGLTRGVLWNADLTQLSKKDLQASVEVITKTIERKLKIYEKMEQIESEWGETLTAQGPLKLTLENGKIVSPNEFTSPDGSKIKEVKFVIDPDRQLRAVMATKPGPDGKLESLGKKFDGPEVAVLAVLHEKSQNPGFWSSQGFFGKAKDALSAVIRAPFQVAGKIVEFVLNIPGIKQLWQAQRYISGAILGTVSGDNFKPQLSKIFDPRPDKPAFMFMLGMSSSMGESKKFKKYILEKFDISDAVYVRNDTMYIGDIIQSIGYEYLSMIDRNVLHAAAMMKKGIQEKGMVFVLAHSQGSAEFKQAKSLLLPEMQDKVHYIALGPEWVINPKNERIGSAENYGNPSDPIPSWNRLKLVTIWIFPWNWGRNDGAAIKQGQGSGHDLEEYKPDLENWIERKKNVWEKHLSSGY